MIMAGGKAGHPFHGLWTSSDGKITTPTSVVIDLPGAAPNGEIVHDEMELPPGDAIRVAIPGQAAVTTTTEEAAAGKTWLNYGILSGPRHRIYGVNLGFHRWLYVAPDKSVWKCALSYDPASGSVSVNFVRFGDFTPGALENESTETASHGTGITLAEYWMIDDISITGDEVLLTSFRAEEPPFNGLNAGIRVCRGGARINISGTPPDATVTATEMVSTAESTEQNVVASFSAEGHFWRASDPDYPNRIDETEVTNISWDYPDDPPNADPPEQGDGLPWHGMSLLSSISRTTTDTALVGLAMNSGGSADVVTTVVECVESWSCSYSPFTDVPNPSLPDFHRYNVSASATGTQSGSLVVKIGAAELIEYTGSATSTHSCDRIDDGGHEGVDVSYSWEFSDYSGDDTLSTGTDVGYPNEIFITQFITGATSGGATIFDTTLGDAEMVYQFKPIRYGNGLFGIACAQADLVGTISGVDYMKIASPTGSSATSISGTDMSQHFATCHPVTGQISRASAPVCFV